MHEGALHRARLVSSVAATLISLACGTNYAYSAWAPQFADKLLLTATQSNLIGLAGNLGMYSLGVPVGIFVDTRGPRPAVIGGSLLLGIGYFPLRQAFNAGTGSVPALCFFSYLMGLGGCMAFAAAVKTSALNWPHHRGTATAFPLAAFGLSAFFFSILGSVVFPGDTGAFLLLLAIGTSGLTFAGFFFLRVLPHAHYPATYDALPVGEGDASAAAVAAAASRKELSSSSSVRSRLITEEPGRSWEGVDAESACGSGSGSVGAAAEAAGGADAPGGKAVTMDPFLPTVASDTTLTAAFSGSASVAHAFSEDADQVSLDETSSLISRTSSLPGDVLVQNSVDLDRSHRIDIRGWKLLSNVEFWQLFSIMGILAGIGLMTINNIGHDANALWKHYDESVSESFLVKRQQMHVSILSIGSFVGRLLSGVGSDFLVKRLEASRVWCLVIASGAFSIAQVLALIIVNPHYLALVSILSGVGYGFLMGVFPSIVAESFGIHGLSQNWGFITLAPGISGNIFNLFYGTIFDRHTVVGPGGVRTCPDGLECYRTAYQATLIACGVGLEVTLLVIRHQHLQRLKETNKRSLED